MSEYQHFDASKLWPGGGRFGCGRRGVLGVVDGARGRRSERAIRVQWSSMMTPLPKAGSWSRSRVNRPRQTGESLADGCPSTSCRPGSMPRLIFSLPPEGGRIENGGGECSNSHYVRRGIVQGIEIAIAIGIGSGFTIDPGDFDPDSDSDPDDPLYIDNCWPAA